MRTPRLRDRAGAAAPPPAPATTLVAPLVTRLGAVAAGGAQAVVGDLAIGLAARGAAVEVVAATGSRLPGLRLRTVGGPFPADLIALGASAPLGAAPAAVLPTAQVAAWLRVAALVAEGEGVVHAHAMDWPAFALLHGVARPVVHTLHLGPVDAAAAAMAAEVARSRRPPTLVAPSRVVAAAWRHVAPVDAVIPNGVDPASVPFALRPQPDLAVVPGRISPEKGTVEAIGAARAAGFRVLVVGGVYDPAYHRERVLPLLDGVAVRHLGAVPRRRLLGILGRGAVAVVASRWAEPFGLVAVEAALAGTPVAATPSGALPEVVRGGLGAVATDPGIPALSAAVRAAAALDRRAVRAAAVRRHSLGRCISRHLALYARLGG